MDFTRYGIYFTPRPGAFAETGAAWLGWDVAAGEAVGTPDDAITRRPRKYGFHGTIKPPFVPAPGTDAAGLQDALSDLAARLAPVQMPGLKVAQLGSFLALVPEGKTEALGALADTVVTDLDRFRAPPTEAELARRRQSGLSPAQEQNLIRWGYPYVFDAFRFHMTLSGPLPRDTIDAVAQEAQARFADVLPRPFAVDSLTLVGEGDRGMFYELHRATLSGK